MNLFDVIGSGVVLSEVSDNHLSPVAKFYNNDCSFAA